MLHRHAGPNVHPRQNWTPNLTTPRYVAYGPLVPLTAPAFRGTGPLAFLGTSLPWIRLLGLPWPEPSLAAAPWHSLARPLFGYGSRAFLGPSLPWLRPPGFHWPEPSLATTSEPSLASAFLGCHRCACVVGAWCWSLGEVDSSSHCGLAFDLAPEPVGNCQPGLGIRISEHQLVLLQGFC